MVCISLRRLALLFLFNTSCEGGAERVCVSGLFDADRPAQNGGASTRLPARQRALCDSRRQYVSASQPPLPLPLDTPALLPPLQVAYHYVKRRRQFGRQTHFADQGAEVGAAV